MFVIDAALRFPQSAAMVSHDEIMRELVRRLDQGLRAKYIADLLGVAPARITEMKKGERRIQPHEMSILASELGLSDGNGVPVVGFVGAGGEVVFEDAYAKGDPLYTAEALPGMPARGLIGLEVRGDSMYPAIRDGYVAFIRRDGWDHVEDGALRDWAVCRVEDGRTLLKEIRRSSQHGRYDLISTNAPPIEGVKLIWATPVEGWRRR